MKNKTNLLKGFALALGTAVLLSGCKREEITPVQTTGQQAKPSEFRYSAEAKIPGENPENGYVSIKVFSDDEAFLEKYVEKLEQSKIVLAETGSAGPDEKNKKPFFEEGESTAPVGLTFNWSNYSFNLEKGKLYQLRMTPAGQEKSLVYYTAYSNISWFNSDFGFAAINVYSTHRPWYLQCLCYYDDVTWNFSNGQYFTQQYMEYHDNLEIRCFQNSFNNTSPTYTGFPYFTINGIVTHYRTRKNYVSPEMPSGYLDVTAITAAQGYQSVVDPAFPAFADLTFYIAG